MVTPVTAGSLAVDGRLQARVLIGYHRRHEGSHRQARPAAQGGDETAYLNAFLDARVRGMKQEEAHSDISRVDTEQRVFLRKGNLDLNTPLDWKVYGDPYYIG